MEIQLLNHGPASGSWNMAVDQFLLKDSRPWLRFYQWERPTLSLGYFQSSREIDHARLSSLGIPLVRRSTGGKAVLHDMELTYSLALPVEWFPGSVKESYRIIGEWLVKGLGRLGIPCQTHDQVPQELQSPNCFQSPGWYEISLQGRKLLGSAQTRKSVGLLQHGSILLNRNKTLWAGLFSEEDPLASSISLGEWSPGHSITPERIKRALMENPLGSHGINGNAKPLSDKDREHIRRIEQERFASPGWTHRL